jgi:hypothetical protein
MNLRIGAARDTAGMGHSWRRRVSTSGHSVWEATIIVAKPQFLAQAGWECRVSPGPIGLVRLANDWPYATSAIGLIIIRNPR